MRYTIFTRLFATPAFGMYVSHLALCNGWGMCLRRFVDLSVLHSMYQVQVLLQYREGEVRDGHGRLPAPALMRAIYISTLTASDRHCTVG